MPESVDPMSVKARSGNYNVDSEWLRALLLAGRCELCGKQSDNLLIDHDHRCCTAAASCGDCVRGVVCSGCNLRLGRFDNGHRRIDADWLKKANPYLTRELNVRASAEPIAKKDLLSTFPRTSKDTEPLQETYAPSVKTLVMKATMDSRGRVNLAKIIDPTRTYMAHLMPDGTIVLRATASFTA